MACDRTREFLRECERYQPKIKPVSSLKQSTNHIRENQQFNVAASDISKEIYQASKRLQTLTQLVRQQSVFNDPTEAINEVASLVKNDITSITMELDNLQKYMNSKRAKSTPFQVNTHSDIIVSQMKSDLIETTQGFKDILQVRQENLNIQKTRKARYGNIAPIDLGKPLLFHNNNDHTKRDQSQSTVIDVSHELPRPNGTNTNEDEHERKPLISRLSSNQIVSQEQNYRESRAEAVTQIESHIVDINQLFGRLSSLISEQGDLVQRIDDYVDETVQNVSAGENELLKYFTSLSNNRMLAFKVLGILFIFTIFFLFVMA